MNMLLLLLLCVAVASNEFVELYTLRNVEQFFQEFIVKYNRQYTKEQRQYRFEIFKKNLIDINQRNYLLGKNVFGINKFIDQTEEEFRSKYLGHVSISEIGFTDANCQAGMVNDTECLEDVPDSFDWRDKGVVTTPKNQNPCGSCYTFSATGNIEGQYAIKTQQLLSLSEQQILDCDALSNGCLGGNVFKSFTTLINEGGLETEDDYPYEKQKGQCRFDASRIAVKVQGCYYYQISNPDVLKNLLYTKGPLSISMQGSVLQHYHGGVVTADQCVGDIDHAVLVVGYGTDNGTPYWIVKNSWGADWGESGFFRLARGADDACSILEQAIGLSVVG